MEDPLFLLHKDVTLVQNKMADNRRALWSLYTDVSGAGPDRMGRRDEEGKYQDKNKPPLSWIRAAQGDGN